MIDLRIDDDPLDLTTVHHLLCLCGNGVISLTTPNREFQNLQRVYLSHFSQATEVTLLTNNGGFVSTLLQRTARSVTPYDTSTGAEFELFQSGINEFCMIETWNLEDLEPKM